MAENSLKNKRILFLSASFFGYHEDIKRCMERMGAEVDYFDERPANTFFIKAIIRINRNLIIRYIDHYLQKIINQTINNDYDYIFVIKGESITAKSVDLLRKYHSRAKFIIYQWDSISNNKYMIDHLSLFDKVFSFDKNDCDKFGINFLPLFYIDKYKNIPTAVDIEKDIDMLFIGTVHCDRYQMVKNIANQFKSRGKNIFLYFYFPSVILYYKMKLINKAFARTRKSDFNYKSISSDEIIDLYKRTNVILDIQHPLQIGLTMRCIETFGAKRKLITTNPYIKDYDFYNSQNILVVDRVNPIINEKFIDEPYCDISKDIYEKYSIESWIKSLLY